MSITSEDLRQALQTMALSQVQFARLVGVSTGAVAQWLSGVRPISGPIEAYVSLLLRLPGSIRDAEIKLQLQRSENMSMNGMYYIKFAGSAGEGIGTLTFKDGLIYGFDEGGGIYDGTYAQMPDDPSMVSIKVSVKMPAGQPSVVGGINQPFDWTLPVETEMPINSASGGLRVRTQLGPTVLATYQRMRSLPLTA